MAPTVGRTLYLIVFDECASLTPQGFLVVAWAIVGNRLFAVAEHK